MSERDAEWAALMRAGLAGDRAAYMALLAQLAPVLRAIARRGLLRAGMAAQDAEDVVQETLLAIHLKRQTWRPDEPIGPWIRAIARNKLVDALRKRGRRGIEVDVDDLSDMLAAPPEADDSLTRDVARHLGDLSEGQRQVVQAIAVDGASIRDTAARLLMSEGAVRVALHRGLAALATKLRERPE
ncbi:sigma-70 family RNA polymerase sigma factor [Ferrovibrio sp.]|uniref:sigma-70 family RNA polymerase sigma factor n=1 Tax=Ferrovibrio sp. TaxID=1917215 RepID=UPI002622C99A|nr:sigma-70 family RNA polymerase sigma factor [Ferrovibrio sp.]